MAEKTLTHRERLEACLDGNVTDRIPVALWRHFPVDDQNPERLAAATIQFQRTFDFDLIKVTPASSFCIKDWGAEDQWRANPEGTRDYTKRVILRPEDWENLPILDPNEGHLGAQLECLRRLVREFGLDMPIIQTIFSPISQAKNLVGSSMLPVHLRCYPDYVMAGLRSIALTTLCFLEEVKKIGISGIFFAEQYAQYGLLTSDEFNKFGKVFDLEVLEGAKGFWLNMLHLHGDNLMFDMAADYPVHIINWHDRQTKPSLADAQTHFPGVVCGGLRQWDTMVLGTPEQVIHEAQEAIQQTNGKRFILGTGCVLPTIAPYGNIQSARLSAEMNTASSLR